MEISYNIETINDVAKQLLAHLTTKTLLVYGDMGVGKTTLIKAIVRLLGSDDDVSSPTFSIVNDYEAPGISIFHFDLYRINNVEELYNLGIEDYLFSDNWSIIEWPEKIESIVPIHYDRIDLAMNPDHSRTIKLKNRNEINHLNMQSSNQ